jgi:light-regulated signal transduction histidine kinase (bacteriophytochrome)
MSTQLFEPTQGSPQETIRMLQRELVETNHEVMALTLELEKRVDERTAELQAAQHELELRNASLLAANRELEAFSSSVSHDLRAPLRHLHGYAQALLEDYQSSLDENGREYLLNITRAAGQMSRLIDDLLSFARTSQQSLNKQQLDFNQIIREIIADLKPEQKERQIDWVLHPLPPAWGDATLLGQVWVNLISNALKYTRQKEKARIEIGSLNDSARQIVFFIKDNGAGFDMDQAEKLFGLFQRLHRRDEFEGTGLGLANVRRIVERHSGRVWGEGKVDQGATFFFSLPRERTP